jgi:cell wall-associated NlpC family hydrolase
MAAIARGFGAIPGDTKASSLLASASMKKIEESLGLPTFSNFPNHARNYGPVLEALGFVAAKSVKTKSVAKEDYSFRVGDVVIFQSTTKSVPGHIQIYDGKHWISDFVQKDPLWPNSSPLSTWQVEKPAYVIYTISDE